MEKLEVGGKFALLENHQEGTYFEITETGPILMFNYASPTDTEITDMSQGKPFEIRETVLNGVMWIFAKCGAQEWVEAPYHPALSKTPKLEPIMDDTSGYGLTLLLVDMNTQTIRHIRLIGLGNRFSRKLYLDLQDMMDKPFDIHIYDDAIRKSQMAYSTAQMANLCHNYWKIR